MRAEALFRRFQRTVEAIDKKSNFPAPKLRQRQTIRASSAESVHSVPETSRPSIELAAANISTKSTSDVAQGQTSGIDVVPTTSTNSNREPSQSGERIATVNKGKRKASIEMQPTEGEEEMQAQKPKVISPELRELLSRKVEILPRKMVRKGGEGFRRGSR